MMADAGFTVVDDAPIHGFRVLPDNESAPPTSLSAARPKDKHWLDAPIAIASGIANAIPGARQIGSFIQATDSDDYQRRLGILQQETERAKADSPIAYYGSNILANLASALGTAGVMGATPVLAQTVAKGAPLLARAAGYAAQGAVTGLDQSTAMPGTTLGQAAKDTALGAVVGVGAGAIGEAGIGAARAAGRALASPRQTIANAMRQPQRAVDALAEALGNTKIGKTVQQHAIDLRNPSARVQSKLDVIAKADIGAASANETTKTIQELGELASKKIGEMTGPERARVAEHMSKLYTMRGAKGVSPDAVASTLDAQISAYDLDPVIDTVESLVRKTNRRDLAGIATMAANADRANRALGIANDYAEPVVEMTAGARGTREALESGAINRMGQRIAPGEEQGVWQLGRERVMEGLKQESPDVQRLVEAVRRGDAELSPLGNWSVKPGPVVDDVTNIIEKAHADSRLVSAQERFDRLSKEAIDLARFDAPKPQPAPVDALEKTIESVPTDKMSAEQLAEMEKQAGFLMQRRFTLPLELGRAKDLLEAAKAAELANPTAGKSFPTARNELFDRDYRVKALEQLRLLGQVDQQQAAMQQAAQAQAGIDAIGRGRRMIDLGGAGASAAAGYGAMGPIGLMLGLSPGMAGVNVLSKTSDRLAGLGSAISPTRAQGAPMLTRLAEQLGLSDAALAGLFSGDQMNMAGEREF